MGAVLSKNRCIYWYPQFVPRKPCREFSPSPTVFFPWVKGKKASTQLAYLSLTGTIYNNIFIWQAFYMLVSYARCVLPTACDIFILFGDTMHYCQLFLRRTAALEIDTGYFKCGCHDTKRSHSEVLIGCFFVSLQSGLFLQW